MANSLLFQGLKVNIFKGEMKYTINIQSNVLWHGIHIVIGYVCALKIFVTYILPSGV